MKIVKNLETFTAPPGVRFDREAKEDYKLGNTGIILPKGTIVYLSPFTVQHNSDYFENPFDFKPGRFITESNEPQYHPYAYFPFGGGPRMCIGMRFAMNEMLMNIARAITKFRFCLSPETKVFTILGLIKNI
jgi:cytochrome P450 family 3 subfamily A